MAYTILKGSSVDRTPTHYVYHFRAVSTTAATAPAEGGTLTGTWTSLAPRVATSPYPLIVGQVGLDFTSEPGRVIATGTAIDSLALLDSYA